MPEVSSVILRRVDDDEASNSLQRLALDGSEEDTEQDKVATFELPEVPTFAILALTMTFDVEHKDFNLVKAEIAHHGETGEASREDSEPILATVPEEYLLGMGASSTVVLLETRNDAGEGRSPGK